MEVAVGAAYEKGARRCLWDLNINTSHILR